MAIGFGLMTVPSLPALAQGTTVIGGSGGGVVVNEAVLDSLGRAPNLADFYRGGLPGSAPSSVLPVAGAVQLPPASPPRSGLSPAALALLGGQAATGRTPALAAQQTLGQLPGVSLRPPPAPAASTAAVATTGSPPASATESAATEATALTATAAQTDADEAAADTAAAQLPAVTADAATEPTATAMAEPASADATAAAPAVPVATTDDTTATATTSDAAATTEATTQQAASQTAALPPSARQERLLFAAETAALPEGVEPLLDAIISRMAADETLRLQILAYAAGTAETSSQARRLSLSRALAVRKYLIDNGIGGTRMDVRALGNRAEDGPADRVDLMLVAG